MYQPVIFSMAISLAWTCFTTLAHASGSSSYFFEDAFTQDQQQVVRESSTYRFYETETQTPATIISTETSDVAIEDSSTTTGASGGGHRGHGTNVQQDLEDSASPATNGQTSSVAATTTKTTTITKNSPRRRVTVANSPEQDTSLATEDIREKSLHFVAAQNEKIRRDVSIYQPSQESHPSAGIVLPPPPPPPPVPDATLMHAGAALHKAPL